jgi:hypothetical protein
MVGERGGVASDSAGIGDYSPNLDAKAALVLKSLFVAAA